MNNVIKAILTMSSVILLASCSSNSELKNFMRCGIVAEELGQTKALNKIEKKFAKFATENSDIQHMTGLDFMSIREEIMDELGLYYQDGHTVELMVSTFNSKKCQQLHEQEDFDIKKEIRKEFGSN